MIVRRLRAYAPALGFVVALAGMPVAQAQTTTLLNVSYDPTREFYQEFNAAFIRHWKEKTRQTVSVRQSHGGSGAQARKVIDGLDADIVTLALAFDVDAIADKGMIAKDWQSRLSKNSSPYASTLAFLVRKGNPKGIKDWDDLIKPGVAVITPNPKTSGVARWNYLAAWGYAFVKSGRDEAKAKEFVAKLYKNVPVLDTGARGATTTFIERGIGDVLINWENEILLAGRELGKDKFDIVVPPTSMLAEPTVSLVDRVVDRRGTRKVAQAYLDYLYSPEGQRIAGKHYYRPSDPDIAANFASQFPAVNLFTLADIAGDWRKANEVHFATGGMFDQIYLK
jgi:sulfate/thiosulfate transport system substrate-binding protein